MKAQWFQVAGKRIKLSHEKAKVASVLDCQEQLLFWQEQLTTNMTFVHFHFMLQHSKLCRVLQYLVDEADSRSLAAIEEVNVNNLQFLQSDIEGFELTVVPVQWDHFEQAVIQPQAYHTALWVYDTDDSCF